MDDGRAICRRARVYNINHIVQIHRRLKDLQAAIEGDGAIGGMFM
jgi:hypothetical protein